MPAPVFLKQFSRNWREVGSVVPSSPFLVKKMLSRVNCASARLVVELGPGTGPLTKGILRCLHPESHLVVVESNESFCSMLREICDARLRVECRSAETLEEIFKEEKADIVFSGLPLAVIDRKTSERILKSVWHILAPGGVFVQFQYSLASKKLLESVFGTVEVAFTPVNVPPAFVYTMRR